MAKRVLKKILLVVGSRKHWPEVKALLVRRAFQVNKI